MKRKLRKLFCSLMLAGFSAIGIFAGQPMQGKAQVMVLGVYHFNNPNQDAIKTDFPDHLSEKKQKEIDAVLNKLAAFKPTKIVIEVPADNELIRKQYRDYLAGEFELRANEAYQLGFKLAKRFGHEEIYPADHKMGMNIGVVIEAAKQSGNTQFLADMQNVMGQIQAQQKRYETMPVLDILIDMNRPEFQEMTRDFYLQFLKVKTKDGFEGADVLTAWYQRNFRISSNIMQVIDSPEDRVLVIFGQGHAPYLREAVKAFPHIQLIEPNGFLK
jgi:hypothetical protein